MNPIAASTIVPDLLKHITPPQEGTLSVTLQHEPHVKVILFGFGAGQELSEHTASVPAIMHQLSGQGHWRVGDREFDVQPGTWVSMPPHTPHSLSSKTPSIMLLTLFLRPPAAGTSGGQSSCGG